MVQLEIYKWEERSQHELEGKFTNELKNPVEDEHVLLMVRIGGGYWLLSADIISR